MIAYQPFISMLWGGISVDYKQILKVILDIGEQMINSGAEIGRVEDSMYRLCRSYGFIRVRMGISLHRYAMCRAER